MHTRAIVLPALALSLAACATPQAKPDLSRIYSEPAQNIGSQRNPVLVIPGVLGSKLEEPTSKTPVWGAFTYGAADTDTPEGARLVALPMQQGVPLSQLHDDVLPTEVLDTLTLDIALIRGVELGAYVDILKTLAAGKYRDQTLGKSGFVDYAGQHYTCFQFPYDWRRDISEQAVTLHQLILDAKTAQPEGGAQKVDVVAHSMGGLVLRYYLRYGPNPLPQDGSPPKLTWEGANHVETAILIGTPSAGSALALEQLVEGINFAALITPSYRPAVLGTMPAIFQLLPRPRHNRVLDEATNEPIDILDPQVWIDMKWGLAAPNQDRILKQLLPDVPSPEERRTIAIDQLTKTLAKTRQFFEAIDRPASPPDALEIMLIAGDARDTPDVIAVDTTTGHIHISEYAPGDDTVTRTSALMDERLGKPYTPRLQSPVNWSAVQFLSSNHLGLTKDPIAADFLLYTLLERPRPTAH